jgi:hypothetical protein
MCCISRIVQEQTTNENYSSGLGGTRAASLVVNSLLTIPPHDERHLTTTLPTTQNNRLLDYRTAPSNPTSGNGIFEHERPYQDEKQCFLLDERETEPDAIVRT